MNNNKSEESFKGDKDNTSVILTHTPTLKEVVFSNLSIQLFEGEIFDFGRRGKRGDNKATGKEENIKVTDLQTGKVVELHLPHGKLGLLEAKFWGSVFKQITLGGYPIQRQVFIPLTTLENKAVFSVKGGYQRQEMRKIAKNLIGVQMGYEKENDDGSLEWGQYPVFTGVSFKVHKERGVQGYFVGINDYLADGFEQKYILCLSVDTLSLLEPVQQQLLKKFHYPLCVEYDQRQKKKTKGKWVKPFDYEPIVKRVLGGWTVQTRPGKVAQQLGKHLNGLIDIQYLSKWEVKRGAKNQLQIHIQPGPRFFSDHERFWKQKNNIVTGSNPDFEALQRKLEVDASTLVKHFLRLRDKRVSKLTDVSARDLKFARELLGKLDLKTAIEFVSRAYKRVLNADPSANPLFMDYLRAHQNAVFTAIESQKGKARQKPVKQQEEVKEEKPAADPVKVERLKLDAWLLANKSIEPKVMAKLIDSVPTKLEKEMLREGNSHPSQVPTYVNLYYSILRDFRENAKK